MLKINTLSEQEASDRGYLSDKIIILLYTKYQLQYKSHI